MPGRLKKFDEFFQRKAAEGGNVVAMARMGSAMRERGELAEAESWFRQAAMGGDRVSMTALAHLLADRGAPDEAERWYHEAALAGEPHGMLTLATSYERRGTTASTRRPGANVISPTHGRDVTPSP